MENCEHEIILTNENWMSEDSVVVELECQNCKSIFSGVVIKK